MKGLSFIRAAPSKHNDVKRQISYDFEEQSPLVVRRKTMPLRNSLGGARVMGVSKASIETTNAIRHGADNSMRMWKIGAS